MKDFIWYFKNFNSRSKFRTGLPVFHFPYSARPSHYLFLLRGGAAAAVAVRRCAKTTQPHSLLTHWLSHSLTQPPTRHRAVSLARATFFTGALFVFVSAGVALLPNFIWLASVCVSECLRVFYIRNFHLIFYLGFLYVVFFATLACVCMFIGI